MPYEICICGLNHDVQGDFKLKISLFGDDLALVIQGRPVGRSAICFTLKMSVHPSISLVIPLSIHLSMYIFDLVSLKI